MFEQNMSILLTFKLWWRSGSWGIGLGCVEPALLFMNRISDKNLPILDKIDKISIKGNFTISAVLRKGECL